MRKDLGQAVHKEVKTKKPEYPEGKSPMISVSVSIFLFFNLTVSLEVAVKKKNGL